MTSYWQEVPPLPIKYVTSNEYIKLKLRISAISIKN